MLTIQNLAVEYYRKGETIHAVRDVSLTVSPGQTLGIVGESGSGKSTIALAILRLIRPNEGRITGGKILFEKEDLLSLSEDRMRAIRGHKIAMIFQDPFTALNPVLRVREQMREMPHPDGKEWTESALGEALERVRLEAGRVLNAYPHQLSGGQRQRVLIATALLSKPRILLADEPTTALDVLVQKEILDLLFQLQKETGVGMLFISHNIAVVAQYTERIAVMKDGRLVEEGPSQSLLKTPSQAYTRELIGAVPRL